MNWKDKLDQWVETIAGDENELSIEHRIFNIQCGLLVIVMGIMVTLNVMLSLGTTLILLTAFAMLIFAIMYYLSRINRKTDVIFWPYVSILMVMQCGAWFINGGAGSSNVITLLSMGILLSVITRKDRRIPLGLFYVFIITALYGSEYFYPQLITPYDSRLVMFIDAYISFLFSFIGLFSIIAILLNNYHRVIRLVEEEKVHLTILTQRDTLTSTYNRRYMEAALGEAAEQSKALNNGYCLIVIDLDHFKQINDRFGHMGGDQVLIEFVKLMSENIGPNDLLGRVGGEEFLIICYETPTLSATEIAENLRKVIESSVVEYEGLPVQYTASFGVSCSSETHFDGRELWKMADKALYVAKNNGRNRVETFL